MASQLFTKLHDKVGSSGITERTKKSRNWFIKELKNMKNVSRKSILNDGALLKRTKPLIGRMFMFFYDPKGKDTLPFYDTFPLVIMVGPAKGGFYGLNLHYLQPRLRALFFDRLMEHMNNDKYDETTKLRLTYEMLSGTRTLRMFQPCFKHYLTDHIVSKTTEVPATEWEIAMFLPTENFVGSTKQKIWEKTRQFRI